MKTTGTQTLFDRNSRSYDRVNSIISLGLDARWRHWVAMRAVERPGVRVLDAFSGTGLVGLEAAWLGANVMLADINPQMLEIARSYSARRNIPVKIKQVDLLDGVGAFKDERFNSITMVFGVRYLAEPSKVLRNLSKLLEPGGKLILLEFVQPINGPISSLASFYFFNILPHIASFLAGQRELYDYLVSSVRSLGHDIDLLDIVTAAGLDTIEAKHFGFGLVYGLITTTRYSIASSKDKC